MTYLALATQSLVLVAALIYVNTFGIRVVRAYFRRFAGGIVMPQWGGRLALNTYTVASFIAIMVCCFGTLDLYLGLPLVFFGSVLAVVDAGVRRLPNRVTAWFTAFSVLVIVVRAIGARDYFSVVEAALCAIAVFLVLWLSSFVRGGIGMGDVKLAPACVALATAVSWHGLLYMVIATVVGSALYVSLGLMLRRLTLRSRIAFGPWILIGAYVAVMFGS